MEETAFSCLLSHCVGMWPGDPTAACSTETSAATYEEEERAGGKEQPLPAAAAAAAQLGRLQKVCISFFFFFKELNQHLLFSVRATKFVQQTDVSQ